MTDMLFIVFGLICFFASAVGAVCGMGGGVIIKPALDAFAVLDASVISFLSGCTVLSMSVFSILINIFGRSSRISLRQTAPLAAGSVLGGLLGERLFALILSRSADDRRLGFIQALCLLIVTICILLYFIFKGKIKSFQLKNMPLGVCLGLMLGLIASFLGIGGGPLNLIVLYFFFSMSAKTAAETSLCIIFFSQASNLLSSAASGTIPAFEPKILLFMVLGGITGGVCGRFLNKKIGEETVERMVIGLMILIILINLYNMIQFSI